MHMVKIWSKEHRYYYWIKYNIYKPIRNWLCYYGYGYDLCDYENTERRKQFIERLKR